MPRRLPAATAWVWHETEEGNRERERRRGCVEMAGVTGDEAVQLAQEALRTVIGRLDHGAAELHGTAGGLDRAIPPVPEDEFGLAGRFIALDEARERFDHRIADALATTASRLTVLAEAVARADAAPLEGGG